LDIFAQRATSHEGRLQVELAQLKHLSTRLIRGWTHLERQKGGIGLRGPGETQLETDRRLIANRIKQLQKRLLKVRNQRQQGRKSRKKAELATVSLVGYTNAGKSTVFNTLTGSDIFAADQLFATLDPTLRRLQLTTNTAVVIADTVGFIRDLPHELVVAFRSTLEETKEAELLLHVIDASNQQFEDNIDHVNVVLRDIGATDIPQLQVFNKIDQLHDATPRIDYDDDGQPRRVWVSALNGDGLELLVKAIEQHLEGDIVLVWLQIEQSDGRLRALVFDCAEVKQEKMDSTNQNLMLLTRIIRPRLDKLLKNPHISVVGGEDINAEPMLNSCG
jgi:GTP-binding protein HflX